MDKINRYPTDAEAKEMIVEIGRRMYMKNFVAANDGNISCRLMTKQSGRRLLEFPKVLCLKMSWSKCVWTAQLFIKGNALLPVK